MLVIIVLQTLRRMGKKFHSVLLLCMWYRFNSCRMMEHYIAAVAYDRQREYVGLPWCSSHFCVHTRSRGVATRRDKLPGGYHRVGSTQASLPAHKDPGYAILPAGLGPDTVRPTRSGVNNGLSSIIKSVNRGYPPHSSPPPSFACFNLSTHTHPLLSLGPVLVSIFPSFFF